ncbi:hypothetical protein C0991_009830 [Blastosporella zonata]|nr:hypothetical protein C0991_009830 [Blastosporella zonata]
MSAPPRIQEQIRRMNAHNTMSSQPGAWPNQPYFPPTPVAPVAIDQLKRYDWLRERQYFEGLRKDDNYVISRLGYKAPNIFVMNLSN